MKKLLITILAAAAMLTPCHSMVAPIEFEEKCNRSDAIIRGVVLNIVTVAQKTKSSSGHEGSLLEGGFTGPSSVAVIRVVKVLKGDSEKVGPIIFVPCGYSFDESPCELTQSKDYILFLKSMGHNYFHPLGPFCMHRVQKEVVGMSGFDWEGDFNLKSKNREIASIEEFLKLIKKAVEK